MNSAPNPLYPTKNTLAEAVRARSIAVLNAALASAIDLERQAKQAHWNVRGPNFIALHELFDKLADAAREFVDLLAERVTALGGTAEGTVQIAARRSALPEYPPTIRDERGHIEAVADALARFGTAVREAIDRAAESGDADTADVFTEISREADKQLWLVESHLHG
jgi:starvation-inducible DNA-binding protein